MYHNFKKWVKKKKIKISNLFHLCSLYVVEHWLTPLEVCGPKHGEMIWKASHMQHCKSFTLLKIPQQLRICEAGLTWAKATPYSYPLVLRRKWCFGLQQWEEFDFLLFLPHVFVLTACSWDMCHMFRASLGIMGWWPRQECRRAHQGCSVLHVSFDGFSGSCFLEAIESHLRPRTTLPSVQGTNAFPKYFTVCLGGFFFFV